MATPRWIGGLSVAVMLSANGMLSSQVVSAELPIPTKHATQPGRSMSRTCIGMDGTAFRWDQPNAPFAAVCSFDDNGAAPLRRAPH